EQPAPAEPRPDQAADRFRELAHDPLLDDAEQDGATDLAAASRAHRLARASFAAGRDLTSFDRSFFQHAHIGDIHLSLAARRPTALATGPVPDAELRRVRRVYLEPAGYRELRQALRRHRLLLLSGAPGTGRTCTALALLDELTDRQHSDRVLRVAPENGVPAMIEGVAGQPGRGHLLELSGPAPQELELDALAAALDRGAGYAVLLVAGTGSPAPARYQRACPPAPTEQLLRARLAEQLADRPELADRAARLADDPQLRVAVGLDPLRPAEAELLAELVAAHLLDRIDLDALLDGCRSLAPQQAREWFGGADRAPVAPGAAADLLHPTASRIALAALNGADHGTVAAAAQLLTWELAVTRDPATTPARPLFADDPAAELALLRAEVLPGTVETAGIPAPARLVRYRGTALPGAVLAELWDRHHGARDPVARWLRMLADDPRPQLWIRAALAAGELCTRDFAYGYEELVRPSATAGTPRRRVFAALALDQAARHPSHRPVVHALVADWAAGPDRRLRWTAAVALGHGNAAATPAAALGTLGRIGAGEDSAQAAVAAVNVVRLACGADDLTVLRQLRDWTGDRRPAYQDLGLLAVVKLAGTAVGELWDDEAAPDLADLQELPLPLALALARPGRARPLADLLWTALGTPRSYPAAEEVLTDWLRAAVDPEQPERAARHRAGLAVLLPLLTAEVREQRRLDHLLRRMMHDPADPLPTARARELWLLAAREPEEEKPR
ncbi:hypothetical protein ACFW1A_22615, partial [Kitasatospora sp. NPDC058965]|uniref:hypothetical protein n=1 Tax=Kitasatospora sp. NPDC058965 TaxID=3346682 RepID=UPI00367B19B8